MVELLAPAGNLEKLKMALHYGADAVYAGGVQFSLRERSGNFDLDELQKAVLYTHELGKKIYIAVNIYAHNKDFKELPEYLKILNETGVDAIIVSDPGILALTKEFAPDTPLHLSTQANTTNFHSVNFWKKQGVSRVVLARELGSSEIAEIRENTDVELEMFVHGAQCMAYSGRCLISNYLTSRGANQGDCSQSCRWNYTLVEDKRPDEFHPVEEDARGTYFFNSRDLSLIEHLPEVIATGIHSLKIEGRMKSIHYTSTVVRAYREALDRIQSGKYQDKESLTNELKKVSHRAYSTGFFLGQPGTEGQSYESSRPEKGLNFLGRIEEVQDSTGTIDIRGKFSIGDKLEVMRRRIDDDFIFSVKEIFDENNNKIEFTKPNTKSKVVFDRPVSVNDILRMYEIARQ
ncbi:MAG: U32 family peptidase [Leptospirales bacterium]